MKNAPAPNPAAGRTRRNLDELKALARDCGWRPVAYLGDSVRYWHPDSLGEELEIPGSRDADRFDERFDAALARLTPQPVPIAAVTAQNASLAERRVAAVLEAIKVGREHGCTTFDMTNLTRMLTEDTPAEYPVAGHPVDPDDDTFPPAERSTAEPE